MLKPRTIYRLLLKLYPARFREEYGGPLERQFWDDYREARGFRAKMWFWMQALADLGVSVPAELARELRQDVAYAFRIYRQRSTVTMLALIALALAIGTTTGVFSVVNALLLRSLPFREPERLVRVVGIPVGAASGRGALHDWTANSPYVSELATWFGSEMTLQRTDGAARIQVAETSAEFFQVLGAEPEIGRWFTPDEDLPAHDKVTVLSHSLWQQAFAGDARVLGSAVQISGVAMQVVGIAPPGLDFPAHAALWTPTAYDLACLPKRGVVAPAQFGRLKPGATLASAAHILREQIRAQRPQLLQDTGPMRPRVVSLRDELAGPAGKASLVLLGAVTFVLLIACSNVAHLLLSRVTERRQELETRAALGASRGRLVQQLITECTLLTLAAALAGLGVAYATSRLAVIVYPAQAAYQQYTILDWRVLAFAVGMAALTGLIFGVLPARVMSRIQPSAALVRTQARGHGAGASRLRAGLIAIQATFTLVLLAGAVTMARGFLSLASRDLGFHTANAVTVSVSLEGTPAERARRRYFREALDRLRAIPGVTAAGGAEYLPLSGNMMFMGMHWRLENDPGEHLGSLLSATPGYFEAMGTEILEGREFAATDTNAVVVSDAFAREFPGGSLVGRRLFQSGREQPFTIVGVVRAEHFDPEHGGGAQVFVPVNLSIPARLTMVARVSGNAEAYLPVCRAAVQSVEPGVPVYDVKTLARRLSDSLDTPRFYTAAVGFFSGFALLLAISGIYGVANYLIVQRTHEIGVRLAMGAPPERLRASLLRQSITPVIAGAVAGLAAAVALGHLAEQLIPSADPVGPIECALAAVMLAATASFAIWLATKRIVRLDPMRVLRAD